MQFKFQLFFLLNHIPSSDFWYLHSLLCVAMSQASLDYRGHNLLICKFLFKFLRESHALLYFVVNIIVIFVDLSLYNLITPQISWKKSFEKMCI